MIKYLLSFFLLLLVVTYMQCSKRDKAPTEVTKHEYLELIAYSLDVEAELLRAASKYKSFSIHQLKNRQSQMIVNTLLNTKLKQPNVTEISLQNKLKKCVVLMQHYLNLQKMLLLRNEITSKDYLNVRDRKFTQCIKELQPFLLLLIKELNK